MNQSNTVIIPSSSSSSSSSSSNSTGSSSSSTRSISSSPSSGNDSIDSAPDVRNRNSNSGDMALLKNLQNLIVPQNAERGEWIRSSKLTHSSPNIQNPGITQVVESLSLSDSDSNIQSAALPQLVATAETPKNLIFGNSSSNNSEQCKLIFKKFQTLKCWGSASSPSSSSTQSIVIRRNTGEKTKEARRSRSSNQKPSRIAKTVKTSSRGGGSVSSIGEQIAGGYKTSDDSSLNSSKHSEVELRSANSTSAKKNSSSFKVSAGSSSKSSKVESCTRMSSRRDGSSSSSGEEIYESYKTFADSRPNSSKNNEIVPLNAKKVKERLSSRSRASSSSSGEQISEIYTTNADSSPNDTKQNEEAKPTHIFKKVKTQMKDHDSGASSDEQIFESYQTCAHSRPSTSKNSAVESQDAQKRKIRISFRGNGYSGSSSGEQVSESYKICANSRPSSSKVSEVESTHIAKKTKTRKSSSCGATSSSSSSEQFAESDNTATSSSAKKSNLTQIEVVPQIAETVKTRQRKCNEKKEGTRKKTAKRRGQARAKKTEEKREIPVKVNEISIKDAVRVIAAGKSKRKRRVSSSSEAIGADANSVAIVTRKAWKWVGEPYRTTVKKRKRIHYYESIVMGEELIFKHGYVALISKTSRPYIGQIKNMWQEGARGGKFVNVNWLYHAVETTNCPNLKYKRAVFETKKTITDENEMESIAYSCEVLSFAKYIEKFCGTPEKNHEDYARTYYLAGYYNPEFHTHKLLKDVPLVEE